MTHHPGLHSADSFVFGIVRNIGCTVEQVINSMTRVSSHDSAASRTSNRFAITEEVSIVIRYVISGRITLSFQGHGRAHQACIY